MAFGHTKSGTISLWRGQPDCGSASDFVRKWLRENCPVYPVVWAPENTRLKGNLGECIAFCCAMFSHKQLPHCLAANAFKTLHNISRPDIDLLWIGFEENPANDFLIQQEVKTTTDMDLGYAQALLADYEKSFGANPNLTLNTHLQAVKSKLKYEWGRPDLVDRINSFQATSPATANRIRIVPTLVHDLNSADPVPTLTGIETQLTAAGWKQIEMQSIAFNGLAQYLETMAKDA